MKKFVSGLAILLALSLSTCEMSPLDDGGFIGYEFDTFGNITSVRAQVINGELVFGNINNSKSARALNQNLADVSLEIFEVVFFDDTKVARAVWELGDGVSLKNVAQGLNYISVDPDVADSNSNLGTAVLFAGRKNGTLLAIGKITAINDVPALSAAVIDANTTSVTFGLSALVGTADSFVITASTATDVKKVPVYLGANITPAALNYGGYILRPGVTPYNATYTFSASAATFQFTEVDASTTSFTPAIRMMVDPNVPAIAKPVTPRILLPMAKTGEIKGEPAIITPTIDAAYINASNDGEAIIDGDPDDTITPEEDTYDLQINMTIIPGTTNGIIALYFQIPVYAVSKEISLDGIAARTWYLRPGYNYNYLSIGANGTGGSVLIAVDAAIDGLSQLDYSAGIEIKTGFIAP